MLVDTENPPESKPEAAAPAPAHSHLRVRSDLHEEYSSDEIAKMTELYEGTLSNIEEGEIVKSKVLRVTDTAVILDVGFKSEGAVPIDEFKDARSLKEGDVVEVFLEHLEDQEGAVVLSKKKADFMRVWERIREAHEKDEAVSGTLVKKIKGGVVVDLMGVDAFLPGSQIALRRVPNIDELLGQSFEFKIIKLNNRGREVPGGHARAGQSGVDHELRRVRRAGAGDRGPGPHLRDELDAQQAPPIEDRVDRRDD